MIKISNLSKIFENKKRKTKALDNLSVSFESKGLCFIVGASGAGKSTLLNILSLQEKPTKGNIRIDDIDISTLNQRSLARLRNHYFGIVFQNLNLIEDFSVYQNIVIGLEIQKKSPQKEDVIQILNSLNLTEEILDEKVYNLSGGQKQRVAIARALIKDSKVIICDEPTGSLDEDNAIEIMKILKEISKDRLVLVVSHNIALSKQYADRIITLVDGTIQQDTHPFNEIEEISHLEYPRHMHLPFKFILKIALTSFKKGMPKFIFTLISFVLTLAVLFVSLTIYSFHTASATEEALISENIRYFDLKKYSSGVTPTYFNDFDLKDIDRVFKGKYILSHSSVDMSSSSSLNFTYKEDRKVENIKNVVYLTNDMLERCNFKIIGALPEAKSDTFEIALTKYQCYYLGWIEKDQMNDDSVFQKLLNKVYEVQFWQGFDQTKTVKFHISGIIDTNYKFLNEETAYYSFRNESQTNYEMHNNVFVSQEIFEGIMKITIGENYASENAYHDVYILTEDKAYLECDELINNFAKSNVKVQKFSQIDYVIEQCKNISSVYGQLSFVAAMILLGISLFSFVGFIRFSVEINKKKMKILRSLGITMLDTNHIFSLQAFFISCVCLLLAIIPYVITIFELNIYFKNSLNTLLSVFHVSFVIIILSFIGLLVISLVVTSIINLLTFKDKKLKIKEE